MKKRDLMEFIDVVEHKAINSVTKRHNEIIAAAKEELFEKNGYNDRIKKIQNKVNSLHTEINDLVNNLVENNEINYPNYDSYDLLHRLGSFTGKNEMKEQTVRKSEYKGGQIPLLINAKAIEIKGVKENYAKVRYVSQSKTCAKDVAEYLEAVGFDISSVRAGDDCVALAVELDKSKLFVCGENK